MNINITCRNFKIRKELSDLIDSKFKNLLKYDKDILRINVVLLKESRAEKIEAKAVSAISTYFSKSYSSAFEKTLSIIYNNLLIQIKKKKQS